MKKFFGMAVAGLLAVTAFAAETSSAPVFQLRLVADAPSDDTEQMSYVARSTEISTTNTLSVKKAILLDQSALKSATAGKDALKQPVILLTFSDAGAKELAKVTRENLHKRLAIVIDGQLCEAPVIQMEITGGEAQISGRFDKKQTEELVKKINAALTGK